MDFVLKNVEVEGHSLNWWDGKGFFNYPALLLSAYFIPQRKLTREKMGLPHDYRIFADSGGYQLVSQGEHSITAEESVQHMEEFGVWAGMVLDYPPVELVTKGGTKQNRNPELVNPKEFQRRMDISRKNGEIMVNANPSFDLYNVVHGYDIYQLKQWYDYVKHVEPDRWGFGADPPTPMWIAAGLSFLREMGAKKVHVLGVSGLRAVAIMTYMQKDFDLITFDSIAYAQGALRRMYFVPGLDFEYLLFTTKDRSGSPVKKANSEIEQLPCTCPVCSVFETRENILNAGTASLSGVLISLHNLSVLVDRVRAFSVLAEHKDEFRQYCVRRLERAYSEKLPTGLNKVRGSIVKSLDFVDYAKDYGVDMAFRRYWYQGSDDVQKWW